MTRTLSRLFSVGGEVGGGESSGQNWRDSAMLWLAKDVFADPRLRDHLPWIDRTRLVHLYG